VSDQVTRHQVTDHIGLWNLLGFYW